MPAPPNPWLQIRERDYVGHMSSPEVGQRAVLSQLLKEAFAAATPHTALVLGCSTGNGFEHVDLSVTKRVVAIDINRQFLATLCTQPFAARAIIETHCADVELFALEHRAFGLVHAALLLEYVEWPRLVPRVAEALVPGGIFSVAVQLPSASTAAVTPTRFTSLRTLERAFHFVDTDELSDHCRKAGLARRHSAICPLPGDKAFAVAHFERVTGPHAGLSSD